MFRSAIPVLCGFEHNWADSQAGMSILLRHRYDLAGGIFLGL
jgi:hypothetical protein